MSSTVTGLYKEKDAWKVSSTYRKGCQPLRTVFGESDATLTQSNEVDIFIVHLHHSNVQESMGKPCR